MAQRLFSHHTGRAALAAFRALLAALAGLAAFGSALGAEPTLGQARRAAGGDAWNQVRSIVASGVLESAGMTANWRQVVDLTAPRLAEQQDAGLVRSRQVWIGEDNWRQRSSGGVHELNSRFGRENAVTEEWLARRGYLQAGAAGAALGPVATRNEGSRAFTVLTATPARGRPVELWFNAETHRLAKTVRRLNLETETVRFDDYRTVQGVELPFRLTVGDGDAASADTLRIAAYQINAATDADFAIPRRPDDSSVAGGRATVPIRFDGDVIVEAMIDGKGPFGFILDTGGHDILTPAAAQAIGLRPEGAGRSGGAGEGKVSEQYARVARMDIGGMTMRDQVFAIIPLTYDTVEQGARPPLAGILGMEIFERFAVRIDYRRQTLTLRPLETYGHKGPGVAVPIHFNDDEPLLRATMNGHSGDFGIDTGNSGSLIVQGKWSDREGLTAALKSGYEGVGFGMGGQTRNWASRVELELAGTRLHRVIGRYQNDKAGAFSSIIEAGNIGNDILGGFTVDFDYLRGVMWFQPVERYRMPDFGRSGLALSKDGPNAFKVVRVAAGSPAAEAGLQADDSVIAVDGVPANRLSGWDIRRVWRKPAGVRVQLEVERGGRPRTMTLVLRNLLP